MELETLDWGFDFTAFLTGRVKFIHLQLLVILPVPPPFFFF